MNNKLSEKYYYNKFFIVALITYLLLKDLQTFVFSPDLIFFKKAIYIYFLDYFFIINLILIYNKNLKFFLIESNYKKIIKVYLIYFFFIFCLGLVNSVSYFDYKYSFISYLPFFLFYFVFQFGLEKNTLFFIIKFFNNLIIPLSFVLFFVGTKSLPEFTSRLAVPITLLIIFIPYLKKINQFIIISVCLLILFYDQSVRTYLINIIVSFLILLFYYFNIFNKKYFNILVTLIFVTPIILILSAIIYKFDIFSLFSELKNYSPYENELLVNTRSFLYIDIFNSINSVFKLIFGSGASASYESFLFSQSNSFYFEEGRYATEVGFLNYLLKSGVIGFILFSLLLFYPINLGINHSNNILIKLISLKLTFIWFFMFVEYPFLINMNYFLIYLMVGILLSCELRKLDDNQIKKLICDNI